LVQLFWGRIGSGLLIGSFVLGPYW